MPVVRHKEVCIEQVNIQLVGVVRCEAVAEVMILFKCGRFVVTSKGEVMPSIQGKVGVVPTKAASEQIDWVAGPFIVEAGLLVRIQQ